MFIRHRIDFTSFIVAATATIFSAGCSDQPRKNPASVSSPPVMPSLDVPDGSSHPATADQATTGPQQRKDDWFEDRTVQSGVRFAYSTGRESQKRTILETVGGGVGMIDFNNDENVDLFCVGGGTIDPASGVPAGRPSGLFMNRNAGRFTDVSHVSGTDLETDYSHGCLGADMNNDGFCDILVTCYGQNSLLLNQGDGTFMEWLTEEGTRGLFGPPSWNTAAAAGDVNGDGSLDLFVARYVDWKPSPESNADVPAPQSYQPLADAVFLNTTDGGFKDISTEAGIRLDGMGLGVVAADLNHDHKIDFYVANDVVANHLYLGADSLPLTEMGEVSGSALNDVGNPEGSMGIACEDVNGDGLEDLWVTNFQLEDNSLYINLGSAQFQHATAAFRLTGINRREVGFGTGLEDFNGDGWPDLYVVNGHVRYSSSIGPFLQSPSLCRNEAGIGFEDVTRSGGEWFRTQHSARGTATGDMNGDGMLDLVVSSLTESTVLLYNHLPEKNAVRLSLVGTRSARTPVGTSVSAVAFGRECVRSLTSGEGYLSHSESILRMAVEEVTNAVDLKVTWPSGIVEVYLQIPVAEPHTIIEGRGFRQQ